MKFTSFLMLVLVFSGVTFAQDAPSPGLTIGPGDLLNVDVFDVPELKQEIRVSDTGDAQFSLLGKIHIADLTVEQAETLVAAQLRERQLVVAPQVSLIVREYATQGVAVTGEVRKPGIYQALGPRSLLQLISEAGGLTEIASPKITIKRRSGQVETVLAKQMNTAVVDLTLHPGDSVLVLRAGIAYIVGDVTRSGGYVMQDEGELSIAQLVALSGGLLPTASSSNAKLVRKDGDGYEEIEVNLRKILHGKAPDFALKADDIVFIPNSILKTAGTRLQNITQMTAGAAIYTQLN
jgi:polysaccharide biosynthesis/export protein